MISGAQLAVLRSRVDGVARMMANAVLRAGRSGVLNRAKDLSCAIVTADCKLLSAADSLPVHVLSGPDLMSRAMMEFHSRLERGDAFLHNSPYHGCSHAADHTVLVPVIDDSGVHRYTVIVKAHQADIGNSSPTTYFSTAHDVYEEGALIFPAVRVQRDYQNVDDIIRMCRLRIRVPDQWYGDYIAMIGAARTGERELLALGAEVGWDTMTAFGEQWLAYGRQRMRDAIRALPAGTVRGSSTHDPMPGTPAEGVKVSAQVEIDPVAARITVDLRKNISTLPCGLNVSESCARSAAMIGIFNSVDPDIPKNAGSFECIDVLIGEDNAIGGARHPASLSVATTNLADRVVAAVQVALAGLIPQQAVAEVGSVNPPHKGVISGMDPRTGLAYINQLFLGSTGGPGSVHGDAWLTYSHAGNAGISFVDSIEMVEMHHPVRVLRRHLVADTEGAGGGCGAPCLEVEYGPTLSAVEVAYVSDGTINAAQGICGGGRGGTAAQSLLKANVQEPLEPVGRITVQPGETVISRTAGGGGYGDPRTREREKVLLDVLDGRVSKSRAREIYGVVVRDDRIDEEQTALLRSPSSRTGESSEG